MSFRTPAELRLIALAATDAGAEVVLEWAAGGDALLTKTKGCGDYVTEADVAVQKRVLEVLREYGPGIPILAEEGGSDGSPSSDQALAGRRWVVDPIDGTTNFLRGFPVVGVSVGLIDDGLPLAAAVAAPLMDNASWSAARGEGAHDHLGRRLAVSQHPGRGIVATGFPFRRPHNLSRYRPVFDSALETFEDLRRAGSASLDLTYVAAGAFDGYFELGLSPWDVAAGWLLVTEAGGVVTDWSGDERAIYGTGDVLAGSPACHERMLDLIRSHPGAAQ